jgi:hypothetical protein
MRKTHNNTRVCKPFTIQQDDWTKEALKEDGIDGLRTRRGVARGGRLWRVRVHNGFRNGQNTYLVFDHDGVVQEWNATKVRKHFA